MNEFPKDQSLQTCDSNIQMINKLFIQMGSLFTCDDVAYDMDQQLQEHSKKVGHLCSYITRKKDSKFFDLFSGNSKCCVFGDMGKHTTTLKTPILYMSVMILIISYICFVAWMLYGVCFCNENT